MKTLKTALVTHTRGIWDLLLWDFNCLHFFVRPPVHDPSFIYLWDVPGLQRAARGQQLPIAGQTKQLISSSPVSLSWWRLFRTEMNANMSGGSTARSSRVSSWHHTTSSHLSECSKHPGGHMCVWYKKETWLAVERSLNLPSLKKTTTIGYISVSFWLFSSSFQMISQCSLCMGRSPGVMLFLSCLLYVATAKLQWWRQIRYLNSSLNSGQKEAAPGWTFWSLCQLFADSCL